MTPAETGIAKQTRPWTAPGISIDALQFGFAGQPPLFEDLNLKISGGRWTCFLGPSGCGKSTLLRLISGSLLKLHRGQIQFSDGLEAGNRTAWMAQQDLLLPWKTVHANVLLGVQLRDEMSADKDRQARELLKRAGLGAYAEVLPDKLSGGMRQRVALLRTLIEERPVILMDEPFSALDALTRLKLQDIAAEMLRDKTVLLVTHDPLEALRLGHHIHIIRQRPAQISAALKPPGSPPRTPGDPTLAGWYQWLLDELGATPAP
jgi:putative hydroxymethylpyrimidine transport system ATP-binding protein